LVLSVALAKRRSENATAEEAEMKTSLIRTIRRSFHSVPIALSFISSACSTTGTAVGELKEPAGKQEAVTLTWKSDATDPDRGIISGVLPNGTHFKGRYFEVVHTASTDTYAPAWEGWSPYWAGWRAPWYPEPLEASDWPAFVRIYTGKVIANLTSDDQATRLRCRFSISDPRAGLVGGGSGDCQLSNGEEIENVVVSSS
jgi:hypothetical protein